MKRIIKIILNILTCLSLPFGLFVVSFITNNKEPINSQEGLYFMLNVSWIFLLFLPISIVNIIYSFHLKKKNNKYKSNLTIGIIFSILLICFGTMYFVTRSSYSKDKNYLYNLEQKIGIDLPNEFSILSVDYTNAKQTSIDNIYLKRVSIVRLESENDLSFTNGWISSVENQRSYVPIIFYYDTVNYEKFLIYCFDTYEYNPNKFNLEYNYVVLGYDYENNNLLIYEYNFAK